MSRATIWGKPYFLKKNSLKSFGFCSKTQLTLAKTFQQNCQNSILGVQIKILSFFPKKILIFFKKLKLCEKLSAFLEKKSAGFSELHFKRSEVHLDQTKLLLNKSFFYCCQFCTSNRKKMVSPQYFYSKILNTAFYLFRSTFRGEILFVKRLLSFVFHFFQLLAKHFGILGVKVSACTTAICVCTISFSDFVLKFSFAGIFGFWTFFLSTASVSLKAGLLMVYS